MVFNRAKNNKKLPLCAGFSQKISVLVVFTKIVFVKDINLLAKTINIEGSIAEV